MKSIYVLRTAVIAGICLFANSSFAQMIGNNIFLKGHYVEVGIGNLGYYGSDSSAPSGFHPRPNLGVTTGGVGFVADVGMDGWTVGTPPYMGDYFLPGFPAEGWELQVSGKRCQAMNMGPSTVFAYSGGMGTCTGANVAYTTSGSNVIGTWQGSIDSITLTQVTTLDTNSLFLQLRLH